MRDKKEKASCQHRISLMWADMKSLQNTALRLYLAVTLKYEKSINHGHRRSNI